jgi:hypothetical protein
LIVLAAPVLQLRLTAEYLGHDIAFRQDLGGDGVGVIQMFTGFLVPRGLSAKLAEELMHDRAVSPDTCNFATVQERGEDLLGLGESPLHDLYQCDFGFASERLEFCVLPRGFTERRNQSVPRSYCLLIETKSYRPLTPPSTHVSQVQRR